MEFLISFLVISIVGTLLHFVYEWSNHNKIVSLFAAVNESTWEHIKIALTPMFLWGLYDGYVYGFSPNYFLAKSISLLAVIIIIPLLFYGYKLITKKSILIIDIMIFYIGCEFQNYQRRTANCSCRRRILTMKKQSLHQSCLKKTSG